MDHNSNPSDNTPNAYATLRAHAFPVTSTNFSSDGKYLISSDEGGWCFVWKVSTRRPVLIFKPHTKSIISAQFLTLGNATSLLTHGRDHKVKVFEFKEKQLKSFKVDLPHETSDGELWPEPDLIYQQDVNALNFCSVSFAKQAPSAACNDMVVFAIPSTMASENVDVYMIDVKNKYQLSRIITALKPPDPPNQPKVKTSEFDRQSGIIMALLLVQIQISTNYLLAIGYESGLVACYKLEKSVNGTYVSTLVYGIKCHSQPVLSLDYDRANFEWFLSTSADSKIIQHDLSSLVDEINPWLLEPRIIYNTKHSGLAHLDVRSDAKLFAIAGWDGMIRVFDAKGNIKKQLFKALAVFKGGRQNGVTTVTFSPISPKPHPNLSTGNGKLSFKEKLDQVKSVDTNTIAIGGKDGRIGLYSLF